jgi:hemolysin III
MSGPGDGRIPWRYERREIVADGVVHALGIGFAVIGGASLIAVAASTAGFGEFAAVTVYLVTLMAVLGLSATYNLWPVGPVKWRLRRYDHAAIFLLIAGTYTPFLAQIKAGMAGLAMLAGIWTTALAGAALKIALPGRFDRVAIGLYLLLGWSGIAVWDGMVDTLAPATIWLLAAGGALYTLGVVFHVWESLRFQNAIWHAFVLAAAICHYAAVAGVVVG